MRPAADRKDAHDVDLQGDHRAGAKTHSEIETQAGARTELRVWLRRRVETTGDRNFAGFVHCVSEQQPIKSDRLSPWLEGASAAEAILGEKDSSCCGCRRSAHLQAW